MQMQGFLYVLALWISLLFGIPPVPMHFQSCPYRGWPQPPRGMFASVTGTLIHPELGVVYRPVSIYFILDMKEEAGPVPTIVHVSLLLEENDCLKTTIRLSDPPYDIYEIWSLPRENELLAKPNFFATRLGEVAVHGRCWPGSIVIMKRDCVLPEKSNVFRLWMAPDAIRKSSKKGILYNVLDAHQVDVEYESVPCSGTQMVSYLRADVAPFFEGHTPVVRDIDKYPFSDRLLPNPYQICYLPFDIQGSYPVNQSIGKVMYDANRVEDWRGPILVLQYSSSERAQLMDCDLEALPTQTDMTAWFWDSRLLAFGVIGLFE
ncbi:hypothetical protein OE88DRAFT_1640804 [Heliocybe sulcata]|uniref:Ubiquitin 3 binding protein But2 C-terminal domain-containing protein n=1 Tax=Heliocybe sulcata TaxID=5364 RepID=A0A5C3NJE4_9AGAM|nr:hypothetical protein OE88DRAFT_1640804 [Heliocybe sulcata]